MDIDRLALANALDGLLETLAAVEHERWAHWQRYLHAQGVRNQDGSLTLPPDLVARWDDQIAKSYQDLSDAEKESDREQVRKYLDVVVRSIGKE